MSDQFYPQHDLYWPDLVFANSCMTSDALTSMGNFSDFRLGVTLHRALDDRLKEEVPNLTLKESLMYRFAASTNIMTLMMIDNMNGEVRCPL